MAAAPKLSPAQWAEVQKTWETDPRDGYTWLVTEMGLPVSAPAVRKMAIKGEWKKGVSRDPATLATVLPKEAKKLLQAQEAAKPSPPTGKTIKSPRNQSKVSENHRGNDPVTTVEAAERDPDEFGVFADLTDQQEMFVREYMTDWNGTQAAIRAKYSPHSAGELAWQLLQKPQIQNAIQVLATARSRRLGIDAEEMLRLWSAMVTFDANELSQHRRICCRFCWSEDLERQRTPAEHAALERAHEADRKAKMEGKNPEDIGPFPPYTNPWYDKRKAINEACTECFGEGLPEVFFPDTRTLSPLARMMYAGVKEGKEGLEILHMSKEKAMDNLSRALGMFRDKDEEREFASASSEELHQIYMQRMQTARDRQARVMQDRGIIDVDVTERGRDGQA